LNRVCVRVIHSLDFVDQAADLSNAILCGNGRPERQCALISGDLLDGTGRFLSDRKDLVATNQALERPAGDGVLYLVASFGYPEHWMQGKNHSFPVTPTLALG